MATYTSERVTAVHHWSPKLFSLRTTRSPSLRFENGQFLMIGLEIAGRRVVRAYSIASANYEEELEFYSIIVPHGPLTSHLQCVQPGEPILVSAKPTVLLEAKKMWKWVNHRELRIAAAQALVKIDARFSNKILSESGLEPAELALAPLDAAPACPWVRQRRYERVALRKAISATISSSWGKSSISVRELSLGGGMGVKEDNLRVGTEANLEMSVGVRRIKGQVLLRRARVNEVGFEIVNMDLESRYRLRRLIMDALEQNRDAKIAEWDGIRK